MLTAKLLFVLAVLMLLSAPPEAAALSSAAPVAESAAAAARFDAAYYRINSDDESNCTSGDEVGRENDNLHNKIKFDATYDQSFSKKGDNFIFCGSTYLP